jgi:hypothetical protein
MTKGPLTKYGIAFQDPCLRSKGYDFKMAPSRGKPVLQATVLDLFGNRADKGNPRLHSTLP